MALSFYIVEHYFFFSLNYYVHRGRRGIRRNVVSSHCRKCKCTLLNLSPGKSHETRFNLNFQTLWFVNMLLHYIIFRPYFQLFVSVGPSSFLGFGNIACLASVFVFAGIWFFGRQTPKYKSTLSYIRGFHHREFLPDYAKSLTKQMFSLFFLKSFSDKRTAVKVLHRM